MAGPITWRSIMGPDPASAARPMAIAAHTINNAFDGLKNTLSDYQTGVKDENTNAYLAALDRYATPEALQTAMQTGELNQLLGSMGPVHQDQVRAAAGDKLTQLLDQAEGMRTYGRNQRSDAQEGEVAQLQLLASLGDQNALQRLAEMDLVNGQQVVQDAVSGYRGYRQDQRAANQDTRAAGAYEVNQRINRAHATNVENTLANNTLKQEATDFAAARLHYLGDEVKHGRLSPEDYTRALKTDVLNALVLGHDMNEADAAELIKTLDAQLGTFSRSSFGPEAAQNAVQEEQRKERLAANPFSKDTDRPGDVLDNVTSFAKNLKTSKDSDLSDEDFNTIVATVGELVSSSPYIIGYRDEAKTKPIHQRYTDSILKMAVAEARDRGFMGNSLDKEIRRIAHRIMMDPRTQESLLELEELKRGGSSGLSYQDLVKDK